MSYLCNKSHSQDNWKSALLFSFQSMRLRLIILCFRYYFSNNWFLILRLRALTIFRAFFLIDIHTLNSLRFTLAFLIIRCSIWAKSQKIYRQNQFAYLFFKLKLVSTFLLFKKQIGFNLTDFVVVFPLFFQLNWASFPLDVDAYQIN